jgi:type I restriction-modification system DNA methylase subunit
MGNEVIQIGGIEYVVLLHYKSFNVVHKAGESNRIVVQVHDPRHNKLYEIPAGDYSKKLNEPHNHVKSAKLFIDYFANTHDLTGKESQHELNQQIESFIAGKEHRNETFSKEEIDFIQQYEGSGGQGNNGATGEGLLYEFFTPDYVCELMWDLAVKHGYDGGYVVEPSVGTGRMIKNAPDYKKCIGFEINPVSKRIAEISFPGLTVHEGYFETAFLNEPRFTSRLKDQATWLKQYPFSLVIGNPPYGSHQNLYSSFFPSPKFKQIEIFFMYYGLQLLKPGGLLIYITASAFLRNGDSYNAAKEELEKICTLVDAYRLPPVFKASRVPTDILVFKRVAQ